MGLPDTDGMTLTRRLRASGFTAPILMLTARDTIDDRVEGLTSGADDYLIKPFSLRELAARVEALLRPHAAHRHGGALPHRQPEGRSAQPLKKLFMSLHKLTCS